MTAEGVQAAAKAAKQMTLQVRRWGSVREPCAPCAAARSDLLAQSRGGGSAGFMLQGAMELNIQWGATLPCAECSLTGAAAPAVAAAQEAEMILGTQAGTPWPEVLKVRQG